MNVIASDSLAFPMSQNNHAQPTFLKHKNKAQFKKYNSRLRTWRFVRLWPIILKKKNMMEKYK